MRKIICLGLPSKVSRSQSRGNVLGLDAEEVAANGLGRLAQKEERSQQDRLPIESKVRVEFRGCTKSCNQLCEAVAQDVQTSGEAQGGRQ